MTGNHQHVKRGLTTQQTLPSNTANPLLISVARRRQLRRFGLGPVGQGLCGVPLPGNGLLQGVGGGNGVLHGVGHAGHLGDSWVGEWVNLGADTTNSNLLNTYTEVTARAPGGKTERTGHVFLGATIGDHVNDKDEIYYVLSGRGALTLNGEVREVGAGHAILTRNGDSHALRQLGEEDLVIFIVFDEASRTR